MVDADFIIVVKYDSDERRHNTSLVYQYLEQYCPPERIHVFESSETPFHRTHYINTMIKQLDAPIIGIWDADVILPYSQMKCAISYVREGVTIAYPYNGRFVDVPREDQNDFYTMFTKETTYMSLSENSDSVGGAFFINKERYTKCGLENENFISRGCTDYTIIDLPQIIKYQKMLLGDTVKFYSEGDNIAILKPDLFISLWAISETTPACQELFILSKFLASEKVFIACQQGQDTFKTAEHSNTRLVRDFNYTEELVVPQTTSFKSVYLYK